MRRCVPLLPLVAVLLATPGVAAEEASCKALLEKGGSDFGVGLSGGRARLELTLRAAAGGERSRTLEVRSAVVEGRTSALVRILAPADVAGTAFLFRQNAEGPDDQVMYLPALKRTRRITGASRRGSFLGSDLSYADLEVRDPAGTTCERLDDAELDGQAVYVVRTRPEKPAEDDPYGGATFWIHQKTRVPLKVELVDREGKLVKVIKVHKIKKTSGRWLATETTVESVERGTSTRIVLTDVDLDAKLGPEAFTERALEQ